MHIIITHVYVWPKQVVLRETWHFSLLVKIAKHKDLRYCYGNHHNNRLQFMISVVIVTGKVFHCSACNNPSDNITEIRYLVTVRLLRPNKTKSYMLTWSIWTSCPQLPPASFSRARLARPIASVRIRQP